MDIVVHDLLHLLREKEALYEGAVEKCHQYKGESNQILTWLIIYLETGDLPEDAKKALG